MAAITCCALLQRSDFLRDAKQFISDDWHLGQVLLVLTSRRSPVPSWGRTQMPLGLWRASAIKICQSNMWCYVLWQLRVNEAAMQSSFILFSHHPLRLYPLVMIQRHAVSGVRWVPVVVCHSVLATCPGCTRLSPCGSWDRLRPSLQTCTGSVINEYNRQNRPKPTTSCSVLFSAAIIAKQEINVKHIKWKQ